MNTEVIERSTRGMSFLPGCQELKFVEIDQTSANEERLEQCVNSIIQKGSRYARMSRFYRGVGGRKFPRLDRNRFFHALMNRLNPLEKNFIGHILTLSGEVYGLTSIRRIIPPVDPPHLQEMAAISMVLENRRRATIELARQRSEKMNEYKRSFGLGRRSSDRDVYLNIDREIKRRRRQKRDLERRSRRLHSQTQVREVRRAIASERTSINQLVRDLNWLKLHRNKREDTTALDIALDGDGVQFSMYSRNIPDQSRTPNYPHWFKTISPDFQRARRTSIKGYLKYLEVKPSLPRDVMNYYSTIMKTPPRWVNSSQLRNRTITIRDGRRRLVLNSDPMFDGTTYQCGESRRSGSNLRKVGHCFYSGSWNYYGHPFGERR